MDNYIIQFYTLTDHWGWLVKKDDVRIANGECLTFVEAENAAIHCVKDFPKYRELKVLH